MRKLVFFFLLGCYILLMMACSPKRVEFDISDKGLQTIQDAAPSSEYVLYISSNSLPNSIKDFENYAIVSCTDDNVGNRAIQVKMGIQIGINGTMNISFANGENSTEGIKSAMEGDDTKGDKHIIVLTTRKTRPPSGAVELIFK